MIMAMWAAVTLAPGLRGGGGGDTRCAAAARAAARRARRRSIGACAFP
jgi:hypothetical protein